MDRVLGTNNYNEYCDSMSHEKTCYFSLTALITNLTRVPSLLPGKRSEEQIKQACKMLSDCFRFIANSRLCMLIYFSDSLHHLFLMRIILTLKNVYTRVCLNISFVTCRYGMNSSGCRAKKLVEYFGEEFTYEKCLLYVCNMIFR